ncbi:PAS domain S-box protein (macronuclear) [Tetrahymena thermophila SB210]|uniref:PAS domain S-box protein n=1 Tax=Tetrahymena thermophila (strain SB210) TaxID=312017 RepID=Q22A99_TETTS|nr:PAS domain S-box protein [Tetrahymena thermophila SB210]EAR82220.2 PAS domain S-box protein [Tetrahymena thermophila SB210]|eukprot:XP_001029883.2 PAS domain S-box protein [Tetrahymena thermophila SB210]
MGESTLQIKKRGAVNLDEISSLEAFIQKIKNITFQVLSVLLKNEEEDVLGMYFAVAVDYLQMFSFPFNKKLKHVWKATTFLDIIFQIFDLFNIQNYMPRINFYTYLAGVYLLVFVILLVILDILYVSYSFSQKKFSITWPLKVLNQVTSYLVTVFFLPITETLISLLECEEENGHLVLASFNDQVCWQGWVLFHQIISSLFNLIFVIISSIVALTFFEPRMTSKNRTARQDSIGEVVFIITKVACQVLFNFIPEGNDWFLALLTFVLSCALFWAYNFEEPYYDKEVGTFFNIVTTYYLWTNTMLVISLIFYETSFNGGLIIWILGLPFIILIMLTKRQSKIKTLIDSQMKFKSGEQVQNHLRYVLTLIQNQKYDKNSYMLLIGYVEKHKETCTEEDCPLKRKKMRRGKQLDIEIEEVIKNLIRELGRLYQNGLRKFPTCTKLRLSYAFFLLERLKKKEDALAQFKISLTTKPTFDEQFIIYRYIEMISQSSEEVEEESDEEEETDVVKKIEFESHLSQFEEYIKLAAQRHKEFWANLKEDNNIALGRLNVLGSGISQYVFKAKDHFTRMIKINSSFPQPFKVYGQFLIKVLNQKEAGLEMVQKGREIALESGNKGQKKEDIESFKNEPIPFIITQKRRAGQTTIQNVNLLFSVFFSYQRDEIIGKDLSFILPNLYVPFHESLVDQFQENVNQSNFRSQYLNNPQQRFAKNRNGYIFPIIYNIRPLNEDFTKYCATFEADQSAKNAIFIMINDNFEITDFSSSALTNFDLNPSILKNQKLSIKISSIIPDWEQDQDTYVLKGKEFTFNQQQYFCNSTKLLIPIEIKDAFDNDEQFRYELIGFQLKLDKLEKNLIQVGHKESLQNSSLQDAKLPAVVLQGPTTSFSQKNIQIGSAREITSFQNISIMQTLNTPTYNSNAAINTSYQSNNQNLAEGNNQINNRITKLKINNSANSKNQTDLIGQLGVQQNSSRSLNLKKNHGEEYEIEISPIVLVEQKKIMSNSLSENEINSQNQILGDGNKVNNLSRFIFDFYKTPLEDDSFGDDQNTSLSSKLQDQKDYGKDIKIKRLINNQVVNVYESDLNDIQSDDDDDNEDSVFNQNKEDYYLSKKEYVVFNQPDIVQIINRALNTEYRHKSIQLFEQISILWLLIILGISIFQFVYSLQQLNDYSNFIDLVQTLSDRNTINTYLVSDVIDLVLLSQNKYLSGYLTFESVQQDISSIIQQASNLTSSMRYQEFQFIGVDHNLYNINFYSGKLTDPVAVQQIEPQNFFNLLTSLCAIVANQNPQQVNLNNGIVNTIIYNYYNFIQAYMMNQTQHISQIIRNKLDSIDYSLIISIVILTVLSTASTTSLIFLMVYIKDERENILFLFLDIPLKHINYLYRNCDSFLKKFTSIQEMIQKSEVQGYESSDDEQEEINTDYTRFKVTDHDIEQDEKEQQKEIMKKRRKNIENYKKNKFQGQEVMVLKHLLMIILSLAFAIVNILTMMSTKEVVNFLWEQYFYDLQIVLNIGNDLNVQKIMLLQQNYPIANTTAFNYSVQNYKYILGRNSQIGDFNFKIMNEQLQIRDLYLNVYYQNACLSLEEQSLQQQCQAMIEGSIKYGIDNVMQFYFALFEANTQGLIDKVNPDNILFRKEMVEGDVSLYKHIYPIMKQFTTKENDIVDEDISSTKRLQTLILILFMLFLIFLFIIFWLPNISSMNTQINRTITMLDMIPLKVIKENHKIRMFVKKLIDQQRKMFKK